MFSDQQDSTPKPYDQLPGEPDRWYGHFRQFCDLGPSRSLDRCYRQSQEERGDLPADPASAALRAPGSWKRIATQFDWVERAAAWDADRRQRNRQRLEETLNLFHEAAQEALQYLIGTMRGQVVEPDGSITTITDPYERRMAAKIIFNKWIDVLAMLQEGLDDDTGEVKITEIFVHKSGNGTSKKDGEAPLTNDINDFMSSGTSPPGRRSRPKKKTH
jgi:hypothetical protein